MKQYNIIIENENMPTWDKLKEISKKNKSNIRVELFVILDKYFKQENEQKMKDKIGMTSATQGEVTQ